ncbi:MAG: PIG-L deacetylase family protein [Haloarculaceae archaeon]
MTILAIVAHPDDADIFCGGTLAKHADRGDEVIVAYMTRGEYGGLEGTETEVAAIREREAEAAADELGAADVRFLDHRDSRLEYSLENRRQVVDLIRETEADRLVTHYWEDPHPDHRVTGRLVCDAEHVARLPLAESEHDPYTVENVYCFGKPSTDFEPDVFVDVSGYMDEKEAAIRAHESQLAFLGEPGGDDEAVENVLDAIRAEARHAAREAGFQTLSGRGSGTYVEPFVSLDGAAYEYLP